jgi:hypothetical protein
MALRLAAVAIAIAGVIDPVLTGRIRAPLAIELRIPSPSDPDSARGAALRDQLVASLGDQVVTDGTSAPHAVIVIGSAPLSGAPSAPVFALPLPPGPHSTTILDVRSPRRTAPGQTAPVTASIRGRGLAGRTTSVALELSGSILSTVEHAWTREDERFEARLSFAPPAAGVHRVRVVVRTAGLEPPAAADTVVVTREQSLRVLAYERRPSWPMAFVRRSLENDPLFAVASSSRTSPRAVTSSTDAPQSLASLDLDRFDAVAVGALDLLDESDLRVLDRFVALRAGTLVLLPDRAMPDAVRRRFGLPPSEEVLLETPVPLQGSVPLRASELLLMPEDDGSSDVLASVRRGSLDRPVITAVPHGGGRVVFSGALDAWRYRADASGAFDRFWRALSADAALASPGRIAVSVAPAIARPGDELELSVALRATELRQAAQTITTAAISAVLAGSGRQPETIRLWPGTRPGEFEARFRAPAEGGYTVSASIEGTAAESPLLIAGDVVRPARDANAAVAHAALASGGAVLSDPAGLAPALAALETGTLETALRPMRSPWWIVPFAVLLSAEWAWRRSSGSR